MFIGQTTMYRNRMSGTDDSESSELSGRGQEEEAEEVAVILAGRDVPGRRQRALEGRVVEVGIRPACRRAERPVLGRSEPVALGIPHR